MNPLLNLIANRAANNIQNNINTNIENNPMYSKAIQYLKDNNLTAEQAVRKICQERGIDVNDLISQIKK